MSYTEFKRIISLFAEKNNFQAVFSHEDGKHTAVIGGIKLIGNAVSKNILVKWGDSHTAHIIPDMLTA